jgi:light-regulated signal transduction histidine kinase (bacteriophytochrome)
MPGDTDLAEQMRPAEPRTEDVRVQAGGYLLELSLDWMVLRASENIHHLLGQSHVTLIDEPLGRFVHAQPLHDLRNLFSRLSGTTGIARAYRVRLTDDPDLVDVAFQQVEERVLLEAVPSANEGFGEAFGSVAGLIAGLSSHRGQALLDGGARRMRALSGYDRVTLRVGDQTTESSRGNFGAPPRTAAGFPLIYTDRPTEAVALFPRQDEDSVAGSSLMHSPDASVIEQLRGAGVASTLRVPFEGGEFVCENRRPATVSFELHAAAELFAQLFAMRLEIDRLKPRD